MELSQILNESVPNAGPQARAAIIEAERRLAMLDNTDPQRAGILREQAIKQISSRDEGITNTLADIGRLHGSSLGRVEPKEEAVETQVAASIEQLLSTADSRNVPLPPALVANAATAFAKGDDKTLLSLSKSIETMLADNIQAQITEEKIPTRLDDGSVVLIGKTTRTRYDPTGAPIPSGNNNTEIFSGFAEQAFAPNRDAMAGIPGIGSVITTQVDGSPVVPATQAGQVDIGARPEAYASMERPALSSIEQKEEARKRVRDLYLSGDKDGALDLLNSAGGKGLFGGDYTIDELDVMYSSEPSTEKPSLDEIFKPEK